MGERIAIPAFTFRIQADDVEGYRRALGVAGNRVPLGMALRALAAESVMTVLRHAAGERYPIHIAQEYRVERPLRAGSDYACEVLVQALDGGRLRIEQWLNDQTGDPCLFLASDIVLVAA